MIVVMVVVVVVVMAVNTVVDHLDELFFEKQLLLDGQFCKPYSVAHVKKTWLDSCSFDNLCLS